MGQPLPPGDLPLVEGLDSSWNDFVSAIPEDKRAELGPKLKERIGGYESQIEAYKPWEDFQKSGITPEHADTAVRLFATIENNPKEVYETIGKHLGITTAEAKEVVKEIEKSDSTDPRIATLQEQVNTLAQIAVGQREMSVKEQRAAEADAAVEEELITLKAKYGDFPEREVVMRMMHDDMTAEEAFLDYNELINSAKARRPAPVLLGQGGTVPTRAIDPRKLDNKATKNLVAQMLDHANAEARN